VSDGYNGYTYDDPVELLCRWEELNEIIMGTDGKEYISQARVFLTQEVDEQGAMWLGSLDDLDSAPLPNDSAVSALHIIALSRLPSLGSESMTMFRVNLNMTGRRAV
jgi:hypothetical protein